MSQSKVTEPSMALNQVLHNHERNPGKLSSWHMTRGVRNRTEKDKAQKGTEQIKAVFYTDSTLHNSQIFIHLSIVA